MAILSAIKKEELIAKDIQYQIEQGFIKYEQKLTERTTAKNYSVSRGTARMALKRLEKQGLISRKPAAGYFVNYRKHEPLLNLINSFSNKLDYLNISQHDTKYEILRYKFIDTDKELSEKLKVLLGTKILLITLRSVEKESNGYVVYRIFLPIDNGFSMISEEMIFNKIKEKLQTAQDADVTLNFCFADKLIAKALHVKVQDPLLSVETTFTTTSNQTCFFIEQYSDAKNTVSIMPSQIISEKLGTFNE